MERIVEKISISEDQIAAILWSYGLTAVSTQQSLGGGRIANNIMVKTAEVGDVIIRAYPQGYGEAKVRFEVDVLKHLSERGSDVPSPLSLVRNKKNHSSLLSSIYNLEIFVYKALDGTTIDQSELSPGLASAAGSALSRLVANSTSFSASDLVPRGDLGFTAGLLRAAKERDPVLASHPIGAAMELAVSDGDLFRAIRETPTGIVHADYFFENVLADPERQNVLGILDFGDAYFGYVINDIIIGAMEFCVSSVEKWDIESWSNFLYENRNWLIKQKISSSIMRKLLVANCVRFAMYTLPFSYAAGEDLDSNKYIRRFIDVKDGSVGDELEAAWKEIIGR